LLSRQTDDGIHEKGCALLISIPGLDMRAITDSIDVDNPRLARDVTYLLGRSQNPVVTPVVNRMLASTDPQVRRCVLDLLVKIPGDEAAGLMVRLLHDDNHGVRQRAWSAAGNIPSAPLAAEVEALCFAESASSRTPEELELMFRALGRVCGVAVLPRLRTMVERKHLFSAQKSRLRREKLLAIAALRYIPGAEAQRLLDTLGADGDTLVRTKAAHATKQHSHPGLNDSGELATAEDAS
jgi:HEAT repeat protein